jgi:hypothetical protein
MKADLPICVNDNRKNKSLKILLVRTSFGPRHVFPAESYVVNPEPQSVAQSRCGAHRLRFDACREKGQ